MSNNGTLLQLESPRKIAAILADYIGMLVVLAGMILVFSLLTNHFFTLTTFRTIANQIPDAIIIATGMTFVLIIAGIDLSVGSVLALSGAVLGVFLIDLKLPLPIAIAACLGTGLICGLLNGLVVVRWALPSFIVTLGMLEIARGAAYLATNSQTKYIGQAIETISERSVFGLSPPFIVSVLIVLAGQFILSRTLFGRYMI